MWSHSLCVNPVGLASDLTPADQRSETRDVASVEDVSESAGALRVGLADTGDAP
jgi:hypothetical protein